MYNTRFHLENSANIEPLTTQVLIPEGNIELQREAPHQVTIRGCLSFGGQMWTSSQSLGCRLKLESWYQNNHDQRSKRHTNQEAQRQNYCRKQRVHCE